MKRVYNVNIEAQHPLPTPQEIHAELPLRPEMEDFVARSRETIENIIHRRDRRLLVVAGPCSIDNYDAAIDYADRLKTLAKKVESKFVLVMRTYFEKPRTTIGWKGMVYDPDLDKTFNIEKGLRLSRKLLLAMAEKEIPTATEFLDPIIPQYLSDLISWAAIGARTTESQTHRQLVSGLSMPVGFKNATDGSIHIAIDAIKTASAKHSFLGVINDGRTGVFHTKGNRNCNIILRGSATATNYGSEYIAFTEELMRKSGLEPSIIIDCSHGNSLRNPLNQPAAFRDVIGQVKNGTTAIAGVMLESYLKTGKQPMKSRAELTYGLSITDGCLGWDETEALILEQYAAL
ncbi:MAG: 3-deoxy-7-phosphoheptulonate synthase [bacterium]|nr:3-deoxy-7-phosphoheptulonate synthase [bacterium]MDD7752610.1 3-deoxy-7-phosphoheptulonate synthase [bacterium]